MAIEITCKKPGFRRAGLAHPAKAVYPAARFCKAELEALRAEPLLTVRDVPSPKAAKVPGPDDAHNAAVPVEFSVVAPAVPVAQVNGEGQAAQAIDLAQGVLAADLPGRSAKPAAKPKAARGSKAKKV